MYDILFYIFGLITVVSAGIVVLTRNIAYAAFSLLGAFFGVAGIYVMLGADFVGVSQLLIYVGGIIVLFLFGMMLTSNIDKLKEDPVSMGKILPAAIVASAIFGILWSIIWGNPAWKNATPKVLAEEMGTTSAIGWLLMSDFSLLFVGSIVAILVALVGAAMISRSDRLTNEEGQG